jgi:hypothetical protein
MTRGLPALVRLGFFFRLGFLFRDFLIRLRRTPDPVALAVRPCSSTTFASLNSNERTSGGPEISDQKPTFTATLPTSTICGRDPPGTLPSLTPRAHIDDRHQPDLQWTVDGEGASDSAGDQGLDAGLVPAEIAEGDIEHDDKQHRTHDAKEDTEETLERHVNYPLLRCIAFQPIAACKECAYGIKAQLTTTSPSAST